MSYPTLAGRATSSGASYRPVVTDGMTQVGIDVARARAETPGCAHVMHFNNAGAALMPQSVIDAVQEHITLEARIGGYEAAERESARLEHTYDAIAALIGAGSDEIALMDSATRAWDAVFQSLRFQPGDRILTSNAEYASNYIGMLQVARRSGVSIVTSFAISSSPPSNWSAK